MNPAVERFGPPAFVLGIALYLGWAPAAPLDLGEDIVRAKSVRWKGTDLVSPTTVAGSQRDPFEPVLVKAVKQTDELPTTVDGADASETVMLPVTGLTENDLLIGLKVSGIAAANQYRWAIVNGRAVSAGDTVPITGQREKTALITEVLSDVVIATADDVTVRLVKTRRSERPSLVNEERRLNSSRKHEDLATQDLHQIGGVAPPPAVAGPTSSSPTGSLLSGKR